MAKLKRTLGLAECVFFGVGSILGAGVYALIGKVAGESGNMIWLSFFIAALTAMCTAFSYAELSAMYPKAGGEFVYATKAFGKKVGTFLGLLISLNGTISAAVVSIAFGAYLSGLVGINTTILALGIAGLILVINIMGIRESSIVNIVFTLIEISGLLFVIYTAWSFIGTVDYFEMPPNGFNGIFEASILAFYAYIGFEEIVKLAEETKNPEKTIPKALFISSVIVLILYSLVAICVVSAVPYTELGAIDNPMALVIGNTYGAKGIFVISIIALFATSNTILSNMLGSSRVIFDMSNEIKILKPFSWIWAKKQTPVLALVLIASIMMIFILIGKLKFVALLATLTIFITFLIVNLSAIILRKKEPSENRPFRIPVNINNIPLISIFGVLLTLILFIYNLYTLIF